MPIWTFIRHGQSEANRDRWFAGHVDAPLTAAGEAQAITARADLDVAAITRAFASDLQRAQRTAELLLEGSTIPLRIAPALRERSCGSWERRPIADIEAAGEMGIFSTWTGAPGGGESLRDTAIRALTFLAEIDDGTNTLIVAHGALLRATIGTADGMDRDAIGTWRPRNCESIVRDYPSGHFAAALRGLTS